MSSHTFPNLTLQLSDVPIEAAKGAFMRDSAVILQGIWICFAGRRSLVRRDVLE